MADARDGFPPFAGIPVLTDSRMPPGVIHIESRRVPRPEPDEPLVRGFRAAPVRTYTLRAGQLVWCDNHPSVRAQYAVQVGANPELQFVCQVCKPTVDVTPLFP